MEPLKNEVGAAIPKELPCKFTLQNFGPLTPGKATFCLGLKQHCVAKLTGKQIL